MQLIETIRTEAEMQQLGVRLAQVVKSGCVIGLQGNLGAGKTTLARGFLQGLGHVGVVKSPTFTVVEPYQLAELYVFHFDLYRIADPEELAYIGMDDYFFAGSICLIEWPEKGEGVLPTLDVTCHLTMEGDNRQVIINSHTVMGDQLIHHVEA